MMATAKKRAATPKQQQPADAPAISSAEPVAVARTVVPAQQRVAEPLFVLPIPEHIHAVSLVSQRHMPSDLRNAVQGRLGCLFTLADGAGAAQDGRGLRLVVAGRELQVFGA